MSDDAYHLHTTNRWGPVASVGLSNMTTASHDHYKFEPLAQVLVSFECKAAIRSSSLLQAKGIEGKSNASIVIAIPPASYETRSYDIVGHVTLLHGQIRSPLHDATCKSIALTTLTHTSIEQF